MKKKFIVFLIGLSLFAVPAFAGTLAAIGTPAPEKVTAITAVDNTTVYLGTAKGNIYSQNKTTGALTKTANIPKEKITAIVTTGTYNYVGTGSGKIYTQTISGGAISATILCTTPAQAIVGMKWDATSSLVWVTTSKGQTYTCTP
jgi:ligand-binding sensor domain-containing protein